MMIFARKITVLLSLLWLTALPAFSQRQWSSRFIQVKKDGSLLYIPDEKGNIIPDFSAVGYHQNKKRIPVVPVVKTVYPSGSNDQQNIQAAIDELEMATPDNNGFRGAVLLKKGIYAIPQTIRITNSGIVLRGEGAETKLVATGKGQRSLIVVSGKGNIRETAGTRRKISDPYVPVGAKSFTVNSADGLHAGDRIILFRPGTQKWIDDLQMNRITPGDSTRQWEPGEYDLQFERVIVKVEKNKIFIDNPVVMALEEGYGGGEIYNYSFDGRLSEVGVENLYCESEYAGDEDEDHGWNAVSFNRIENGWVKKVTSRYFGYSCVNLGNSSKNITVDSCQCLDAKSKITGGRRYSFNNDGQLNLFRNCAATEGRHDYVTGAKVCGPNVFYNCTAARVHADIGPHHRWAMGTLFDNIRTDGEINVQDRGNWGTGHGWSGVNQVIWNCTASKAAIQNPWVSGRNYCIGLKGGKYAGRLQGRPDGEWEGQNLPGLQPASLYLAQVKATLSSEK